MKTASKRSTMASRATKRFNELFIRKASLLMAGWSARWDAYSRIVYPIKRLLGHATCSSRVPVPPRLEHIIRTLAMAWRTMLCLMYCIHANIKRGTAYPNHRRRECNIVNLHQPTMAPVRLRQQHDLHTIAPPPLLLPSSKLTSNYVYENVRISIICGIISVITELASNWLQKMHRHREILHHYIIQIIEQLSNVVNCVRGFT